MSFVNERLSAILCILYVHEYLYLSVYDISSTGNHMSTITEMLCVMQYLRYLESVSLSFAFLCRSKCIAFSALLRRFLWSAVTLMLASASCNEVTRVRAMNCPCVKLMTAGHGSSRLFPSNHHTTLFLPSPDEKHVFWHAVLFEAGFLWAKT